MTAIVEVAIATSLKSLLVCKLSMKLIIQPVKLLQVQWAINRGYYTVARRYEVYV